MEWRPWALSAVGCLLAGATGPIRPDQARAIFAAEFRRPPKNRLSPCRPWCKLPIRLPDAPFMSLPPRPVAAPLVLYFEDYPAGRVFELGEIDADPDEVQAFAQRFDPQPFHIDARAAAQSPYGGIIASGWHTASLAMRLLTESFLSPASSLGSPGIDELRWLLPVRPGDRLSGRASILSAKRSRSRPDRGIAITLIELRNQREETVLTMRAVNLLACRPVFPPDPGSVPE